MSLRLQRVQVARLAPKVLGESAELVGDFILRQLNPDGGFRDRAGRSDLYYTVFGLDSLAALQRPVPEKTPDYLRSFGSGADLDFVHLCCLAHCWDALTSAGGPRIPAEARAEILEAIETFRTEDGGYNVLPGPSGTAYGAVLAYSACEELGAPIPEPLRLVQSLKLLERPDGGWANDRWTKTSGTNPTAAAVMVLKSEGMPINSSVGDWIIERAHPMGGFAAASGAPVPDLLSTATALHALSFLEREIEIVRESCLDFIDTLWSNEGGFHGNWTDEMLDCEYTYYGLLALGHLAI